MNNQQPAGEDIRLYPADALYLAEAKFQFLFELGGTVESGYFEPNTSPCARVNRFDQPHS